MCHFDAILQLEKQDGSAFVDEQGRTDRRTKLSFSVSTGTLSGWISTKLTMAAGQYRLSGLSSSSITREITEIRAVPQTHPSYDYVRPIGEVEVVIDAYRMQSNSPDFGRFAAFTDGLTNEFDNRDCKIHSLSASIPNRVSKRSNLNWQVIPNKFGSK